MTAVIDIMDAIALQIDTALGSAGTADPLIENLQVVGRLQSEPTPPCIDMYPANPFQEGLAFGKTNNDLRFAIRARVLTADREAGQELLLNMMDPSATTSLAKAIANDRTLGNKVSSLSVEGPSGFGVYRDSSGAGNLLGATWTVRIFP